MSSVATPSAPEDLSLAVIDRFIEDHRLRCLWYLREDYAPATPEERLDALARIARSGDREAFQRAGELTRWLSQTSSGGSAGS
jgi:hypothetical protein